jgi:hypothetical protein
MNLIELNRALGQLRLGGIAAVLETRLRQAQAEAMPPIDFLSCLISDELTRRGERLLERRTKKAEFRDPQKTLDNFDFNFNRKMNRSLVFDLATGAFVVIDRGEIRDRKKKPSKKFRDDYGHTPLSIAEDIPWKCGQLVVGTGAYGRLPVMKEVKREAKRRKVELVVLPTSQAIDVLKENPEATNAILHVTC